MIQLDEHYRVEEDSNSWNLVYEKLGDINPNTGKPIVSSNVSYHANLKQALVCYLNESASGSTELQDVIRHISEAEDRINKAVIRLSEAK